MDIVERLRGAASQKFTQDDKVFQLTVCGEAADEIEQLREDLDLIKKMARAEIDAKLRYAAALRNIANKNPFHNQCPPAGDTNYYGKLIAEMVVIANAALKEKE